MNATCERLIGTLRREVLDRMLTLDERHLRAVLTEYQVHYNTARPHQGIAQRVPDEEPDAARVTLTDIDRQQIRRKPILGGLINEYTHAACPRKTYRSPTQSYFRAGQDREAGLLRSYRREHDVPLKELRDFIDRLREEFQVPYPLADRRPYVGPGRRLLIDLQDRSHLDPEFCLVAVANGQTVLTAPGEEFYERVDWSGDEPAAWRPHEDPVSPVRVNPLVRFGMPAIGGISTEAIAGELDGGASLEEVAGDFGLEIDAVRWAQSYELSQRAAG